ncbi:MAG: MCP methyltransferase, CheR-type [Magnetococcales bacterium]|nr:MCP methyltransferase, CheR-type [Magnetococcales bacterium]HIJ83672.1 protein-glutamate O-methyltransferase CheR [Magnetococcales bacterium]
MAISKEEFQLIRKFLHDQSGILVNEGKEYLVENRLTVLLVQNGCENFFDLHEKLKKDAGPLRNKVIDAMTTNETLWFRDASFATAVTETVVPHLVAKAATQTVRIWSAACSTGQEPYSIAMLLHEAVEKMGAKAPGLAKFKILGTDISPSAIVIAKTARYSQLAISRGMKPDFLERYFTKNGMVHEVKPEIRSLVEYKQFNLKDDFSQHGQFDFVMCRNVLIYFSEELKKDIYQKIHRGLAKDGWMAIGASESPRGYTDAFEQVIVKGAALFRPKRV